MFCPNCGNQVEDGSKFCANCGKNLTGTGVSSEPNISKPLSNNSLDLSVIFPKVYLGLMIASLIVIAFNIGGNITGFDYIKMHFNLRELGSTLRELGFIFYLNDGNFLIGGLFFILSHLFITIGSVAGIIKFNDSNANFVGLCTLLIAGGVLGIIADVFFDIIPGLKILSYTRRLPNHYSVMPEIIVLILGIIGFWFPKLVEKTRRTSMVLNGQRLVQEMPDFTDERDGQTYKVIKIGKQVWMAENLNYETKDSYCYENAPANCEKYGRLYTWEAALNACPLGWHLPTKEEFETLVANVGEKKLQVSILNLQQGGKKW